MNFRFVRGVAESWFVGLEVFYPLELILFRSYWLTWDVTVNLD